jgi:hypothetical protein
MSGIVLPVLVFSIVASPLMFKLTRCAGPWIASPEGVASIPGLLLHGVVFVLLLALLRSLFFSKTSGYLTEGGMRFETRDDQDDQNTKHFQEDRFVFDKMI